jgi:hypothetical protein
MQSGVQQWKVDAKYNPVSTVLTPMSMDVEMMFKFGPSIDVYDRFKFD